MKKMSFVALLLFFVVSAQAQKVNGKLKFEQGQLLQVETSLKSTVSQQVMGQSVDFNADGNMVHTYKVTNTTDDNSTLHHETKQIKFTFEGMGQKRPFDSNNSNDMSGPFGSPVKDVLNKKYDMIINPVGTVLMAHPEKFEAAEMDERAKLIAGMLKEVFEVANPPKKGTNSFFAVIPAKDVDTSESWTESYETPEGKYNNTYKLSAITDSTIVIAVNGSSNTNSKTELMGMEIVTKMSNKSTGTITVDRTTGIIRQKEVVTESTGTTTGMGGETPLTAKTIMKTTVAAVKE
jgi:hypothetical protein